MSNKLHLFLIALALALTGLSAPARAGDVKTAYAMSDNGDFGKGIYTFELGDTVRNIKQWQAMNFERVSSGLLLNNTYYYLEYQQVYNGYKPLGLYAFDMDAKTTKQIADYGGVLQGPIASCFSYDYQSGIMYGLDFFNGGNYIVTIDMNNGTITRTNRISFDVLTDAAKQQSNVEDHLHVMTSTYDGDLYGVSYWGGLYKVSQYTGQCHYIGTLDYNPGDAFMYTGDCLFYDNEADQLYMRFTTYNWDTTTWLYEIVKIDTKTAHVTRFANVPAESSLNAICIPFTVAQASAPAKVQNAKITRGTDGALTATLDWDNPSKTYGRGGTLEDLDYVLVFRDGQLVDSIANPVIGGHQTWTDNNIKERGYYAYKIVGGNDMGRGDRLTIGTYIGKGDPLGVTNLTVGQNKDGANLSWTAPTEGKLGSYINTASLSYEVVRINAKDSKPVTVAKNIKSTSFSDDKIDVMGKYTYAVLAHTDNAVSDSIKSEAMVLGPAYDTPVTFGFETYHDFNLWTTIDANGNNFTWEWSDGSYGTIRGACCSYEYDEYPAADWLISPRIKFEQGKRYKVTFDAKPKSRKVKETLAVSFGQGTEIEKQDSVTQFEIVSDTTVHLRANLPQVKTTGEYNVGYLYRSNVINYQLSIGNIQVSEDHEGYIAGTVTNSGKPVAGATVIAAEGQFKATTDKDGRFDLDYLPAGSYTVRVMALGYEDAQSKADVTQYDTTTCNIALTTLPTYTVKGVAKDVAGDPVATAKVVLSGYDNRETTTAADGSFAFEGVYKNSNYAVTVTKNKLLDATRNFAVEADTDLGTLSLADNHKPAGKVTVSADGEKATVSWKAPANDASVQRIDDGTLTTSVGVESATDKTMFGVVKREPATVSGVQFYIDGTASITHYSVQLNIFDLDDNGEPTSKLLYQNTYVPATDGQWNTYTLKAPVDAPRGYYMALSYNGYLLVGIDGNGDEKTYPFVERVNCFTPDYTTGQFAYLDDQTNAAYHHNFLIRPVAAPVSVPEDSTEFKAPHMVFAGKRNAGAVQPQLSAKTYENTPQLEASNVVMKTPQSRIRYNVYRMKPADKGDEAKWTLLSENQQARSFDDTQWASLPQGTYAYAVKAAYTGGALAEASLSDSIGNKMLATVKLHLITDTPDNEAYGAKVTLTTVDGSHISTGFADDNGEVLIDSVWKADYTMAITLDGFKTVEEPLNLTTTDNYEQSYTLQENRVQPFHLIIDEGANAAERRFMWNYPDVFFDDFEAHEDFAINSPGTIGWQYVDGDEGETGGFYNYQWPGEFQPMAYIVFNPKSTTPAMNSDIASMLAYSGDKCLNDWAVDGRQSDDWIITPKLYFDSDFRFSFYAKSMDNSYKESFEVAYSTTDTRPESFTLLQDSTDVSATWTQFAYDVPKDAKYVAIRCISQGKRVFYIDDIRYGLPQAMNTPAYLVRPQRSAAMKSPSLDGLYEVYLDGEKVAQQDATEYTFTNLAAGKHTAGVLASYTSGKTQMSTIEFNVDAAGIQTFSTEKSALTVNGSHVVTTGSCTSIAAFTTDGKALRLVQTSTNTYRIENVPAGVYVVKAIIAGQEYMVKATIK